MIGWGVEEAKEGRDLARVLSTCSLLMMGSAHTLNLVNIVISNTHYLSSCLLTVVNQSLLARGVKFLSPSDHLLSLLHTTAVRG